MTFETVYKSRLDTSSRQARSGLEQGSTKHALCKCIYIYICINVCRHTDKLVANLGTSGVQYCKHKMSSFYLVYPPRRLGGRGNCDKPPITSKSLRGSCLNFGIGFRVESAQELHQYSTPSMGRDGRGFESPCHCSSPQSKKTGLWGLTYSVGQPWFKHVQITKDLNKLLFASYSMWVMVRLCKTNVAQPWPQTAKLWFSSKNQFKFKPWLTTLIKGVP